MNFKKIALGLSLTLAAVLLITLVFHNALIAFAASSYLQSQNIPLKFEIKKISTNYLELQNIQYGDSNKLEFLKLDFELKPEFTLKNVSLKVDQVDPTEFSSGESEAESTAPPQQALLDNCDKIADLKITLEYPGIESSEIHIQCQDQKVRLQTKDAKMENISLEELDINIDKAGAFLKIKSLRADNIGPIHMDIQAETNPDTYNADIELSIGEPATPTSQIQVRYKTETGEIEADISKAHKSVALKKLLEAFLPEIYEESSDINGNIKLYGKVIKQGEDLKLNLNVRATDVGLKNEDIQASGINLKHSVIGYPSMKSGKRQSFKAKKITVGASIEDISVQYQVNSQEKVSVDNLKASFEGALFEASDFVVYPSKKQTGPVDIRIDKLDLGKFLKLALGATATAQGELDGQLKMKFVNNRPVIEAGLLKAKGPGRIQYRPPTSKGPPDPDSFSADPMEILNAYLYDYYYETLSVSLSSNENFEMKMTLSALGKNPGYLNGKSLKLNVNLEQNLLAAFKAMMLSYSLPKRLEEKITALGNQ